MIFQYIYKPILNFSYEKITCRIPEKIRNIGIFICFISIFAAQFLSQYVFQYEGFNRGIRDYLICLLIGFIILFSVNKKLQILKWNLWIYIPFVLSGILLFIASMDHEMGPSYQAFPITMLIVFMCLFYVWGNRQDYDVLFSRAAGAYTAFICIIFLVCVIKYPYEANSYSAYTLEYAPLGINPNGVTKLFIPGVVCGLYLMIKNIYRKIWILYAVLSGICAAVVLLTKSRTGEVCIILLAILMLIYCVISFRASGDNAKKYAKKGAVALIVLICSIFVGIFMLDTVSETINKMTANQAEISLENNGNGLQVTDDDEIKTVEAIERDVVITERFSESYSEISTNETMVKMDAFMAGRLTIWNAYFNNMTWQGNDELLFYDTEYAHNQYIELSYKAGYPMGIIYFITVIIAGLYFIKIFFKNNVRAEDLFKVMIWCVFFVISMLDTGILPFERGFIFLFYISLSSIFIKGKIDY